MLSAFVRVPDVSKERALSLLLAGFGWWDGWCPFHPLGGVVGTMVPISLRTVGTCVGGRWVSSRGCVSCPQCVGGKPGASDHPWLCDILVLWRSGEYLVIHGWLVLSPWWLTISPRLSGSAPRWSLCAGLGTTCSPAHPQCGSDQGVLGTCCYGLCQPLHHLPRVSTEVTADDVSQSGVFRVLTPHVRPVMKIQVRGQSRGLGDQLP